MDEEQVVALMASAKSEQDWNAKCDEVKEACGGYPAFWFPAIIMSGLADRVTKSFGSDADIHVVSPD